MGQGTRRIEGGIRNVECGSEESGSSEVGMGNVEIRKAAIAKMTDARADLQS